MTIRLVAEREPYLSYADAGDPSGSLVLFGARPGEPPGQLVPDLLVLPAALVPGALDPFPPAIAYGPVSLMSACYEAGALDYLREPWALPELRARALRLERLRFRLDGARLELSGTRLALLDPGRAAPGSLHLGPAEARVLRALSLRPGEIQSREVLSLAARGSTDDPSRSLDVQVATLRRALESILPGSSRLIRACRGRGYRLLGDACG